MTFPHAKYLLSLGMGDVLVNRLARIHDFYQSILPEPIEDIFVNDYFNEDGTRSYESAWFFTGTYAAEARNWETSDDWDLLRITRIRYWRFQKENFEFDQDPSEASRLSLDFYTLTNEGSLRAAGNNCLHLRDVFLKHVMRDMGET